jgi:predicted NAD-dependent protein-ADP-ribosyltransferase YbiA (DUF1768 family)
MRVLFKKGLVILAPESAGERAELAAWKATAIDCVFAPQQKPGTGVALANLGHRDDVCREPINISSRSTHPAGRWISNFAEAPFTLDGRDYRTVEGFWQGLKFDADDERRRIAQLTGPQAKKAGQTLPYGPTVTYDGRTILVGTRDHWDLMERACRAKFEQHDEARAGLLSTGERPIEHRMRRDSRSIPGVIMADIWMRRRRELQKR